MNLSIVIMKRASICAGINTTMYIVLSIIAGIVCSQTALLFTTSKFFTLKMLIKKTHDRPREVTEKSHPRFLCDSLGLYQLESIQNCVFIILANADLRTHWTFAFNTMLTSFSLNCLRRRRVHISLVTRM